MNLERAFLEHGHTRCHLTRSTWGSDDIVEQDALRNLDGPGWHLDRGRFDAWLADMAVERGAAMLARTRLLELQRDVNVGEGWQLKVERMGKPLRVRARLLADASGRDGVLARHVGAERRAYGKLVCGWVFGHDSGASAGVSELHAEEAGWWYSASLPGRRRLVAFYTDADLPSARSAHSSQGLLARLERVPHLHARLASERFEQTDEHGFCAAHSVVLDRPWGEDWLAIGDAALAFDPLSSQGLFNALYTGLAGAEAAYRYLQGERGALDEYGSEVDSIDRAYRQHLDAWYRLESRWPESEFWKRRHGSATPT